jgi:hypothetical protein
VGIDRSDNDDVPSDERSDRADVPTGGAGARRGRANAETRDREEYYTVLHTADANQEQTEPVGGSEPRSRARAEEPADRRPAAANQEQVESTGRYEPRARSKGEEPFAPHVAAAIEERIEPARRGEQGAHSKSAESAENGQQPKAKASWEETAEKAVRMWSEYKRRWPPEERPQVDRSKDSPGSWHGDGDRVLASSTNERIEAECDRIAEREEQILTPRLREVERQDPHRGLVGLDHCRKGRDRIKEKVCDNMRVPGVSPEQAVSFVPDAIRFTFQFEEARYTQGVLSDITRLENQGFKLEVRKNFWTDDQYKGINSQWIEPLTGQRFEVQFHTRISYEAKQLTHPAYERLRADPKPDEFEQMVLEAFEKKVTAEVPVPPGALDIANYPERRKDAR